MSLWTAPATKARAVTKSDTTVIDCRSLYVGGAGDVAGQLLDDADGTTVIFSAVPAGAILPVSFKRVYSAGTSATLMLALY